MKYTFLIVLGLGLMLSSCLDFLEEQPTGSLTSDAIITSSDGALAIVLGPYRSLPRFAFSGSFMGTIPSVLESWCGKYGGRYGPNFKHVDFDRERLNGFDWYWEHFWQTCWQGVQDCNLALEMIPKTTITPNAKARYIAELRALRAWYYFNIVRYWGDAPLVNSVVAAVDEAQKPRVRLQFLYDNVIIPDLEAAIAETELPDAQSSDGRVTKYTARMILADVCLTCAGYPYQEVITSSDTTKRWCQDGLWAATAYPVTGASAIAFLQKAKTQLDELYGKFNLGTYDDLHNDAMNNKGEAIFQAQFLAGSLNNSMPWHAMPYNSKATTAGDVIGGYFPIKAYYDSYNPADKRTKERQMFFTSDTKTKQWDPNEGPDLAFNTGNPYLFKFYDMKALKQVGQSSLNWTIYRYAEALLMLTEVNWTLRQLGQSVSDNDIVKGINQVRSRALLPEFLASGLTLKDIMSERAYELIFENKMVWDMRRTRHCLVDGSGEFSRLEPFTSHKPSTYDVTMTEKFLLAPIPGTEISNNRNCEQNYGHTPLQIGQQ